MKQLTKALLIVSLTAFTVGFVTDLLWGFGMPVGAIFLGLFMIPKMLEKEMATYDEEHRPQIALADKYESGRHTSRPSQSAQNTGSRRFVAESFH